MTTQEFIDSYKLNKDLVKHIKQDYVPYLEKVIRCEKIVDVTCRDKETGNYYRNSPNQALLFTLTLIDLYTDIEIDFNKPSDEYDVLEKDGYIEKLIECISKSEVSQFRTLLSMINDDLITNERNITSFLEHKLDTLIQVFTTNTEQ